MKKRRLKVVATLLAVIFLCACQAQQPDAKSNTNATDKTAAKADPSVAEEVKAMLAKHDKALNDQDLNAVLATFSTDPKTVLLGTGKGERYVGTEAIKQAYTEIFKDYDKGTLAAPCDWKTGGADDFGKMAWLAATCQAKDSMKGVPREYVLNVTGAVVKEDSGWRFVMLHMSNATASGPPPEVKK